MTDHTTPELLACPFCGGNSHLDNTDHPRSDGSRLFWVDCYECGISGKITETADQAIKQWNTRATTQERAAPREGVSDQSPSHSPWFDYSVSALGVGRAVTAAPQEGVSVPPGYTLVPIEPTSNMLAAMSGEWHTSRHGAARKQYAAALSAAPQPPASALPLAVGVEDGLPGVLAAIVKAMKNYRCQYHQQGEDGGGMPLADVLTEPGAPDIRTGLKEIFLLAEDVFAAVEVKLSAAPPLSPPATGNVGAIPVVVGPGVLCSICGLGRHVAGHRPLLSGPNAGEPLDHVFTVETPPERRWMVFCDKCGTTWSVPECHDGKDRCEKCTATHGIKEGS